ncbi:MAG: Crp/Fnr family transcriptional regulator [Clostridia bacterium]|nr:Crp/Fnr family transcriptional regulator [Clostridia bacterium]
MSVSEDEKILSRCGLFEGCAEQTVNALLQGGDCLVCDYKKGEAVTCTEGALGILMKGRVTVSTLCEGRGATLNCHEQGAVFGFSSLFEREPLPFCTDMRADTSSTVLWIKEQSLMDLMAAEPMLARNIIAIQAEKIRFLNDRLLMMTLPDAEERLYRFLCALQNEEGCIEKLPNMARLAPRLNMSRASLYRVLDKLIEDGKIEKSGNTLIIKQ